MWGYNLGVQIFYKMAKAFTTTVKLRKYESKQGRQIFIRVRTRDGFETEIPVYDYVNDLRIPISVKNEHWQNGKVIGGSYHISLREINRLISNVEYRVEDAVSDIIRSKVPISRENIIRLTYINQVNESIDQKNIASGKVIVNEEGGAFASQAEFEEYIAESSDPKHDKIKKALGIISKEYLLDYWDDFIRNYAPDSYNLSKHSIVEYIEKTGDNCRSVDFSEAWLKRYFAYIIKNGYSFKKDGSDRKDYSISTINKYLKHLKSFGRYLFTEVKVLSNENYSRFSLKGSSKKTSLIKYSADPYINTHALYKSEFDLFYSFKFDDNQLETARDMFIIQTWLGGLRQSDFYRLTPESIQKDANGDYRVWFDQKKTDDEVFNFVNKNYLQPKFDKYHNGLPVFLKVHDYNRLLKVAAKVAGLDRKLRFRFENSNADDATNTWHPIHKKIANKWARNCVVSILAELGYPDDRIATITGHKDMEMIKHYKQIHQPKIKQMLEEVKPEVVIESKSYLATNQN